VKREVGGEEKCSECLRAAQLEEQMESGSSRASLACSRRRWPSAVANILQPVSIVKVRATGLLQFQVELRQNGRAAQLMGGIDTGDGSNGLGAC